MPIEKLRPSFTFTEDRLQELRAVIPEAFTDGKIAWDVLREALGEHLQDESQEHFGLSWPGKREARRLATTPSKGTLVLEPGAGVNEDITRNIFIEGDNLEVLKLLLKSYAGRVKLIYIDPPYNTGNDFVYPDDYSEPLDAYLRHTGQADEAGQALTTNSKASGRFHSNWLSMMYPRLLLARHFLRDDGAILVSIDDGESHNLRQLMNEVFGEENFIDNIIWKKRYGGGAKEKFLVTLHEYVLFYAKNQEALDSLFVPLDQESIERYYRSRDEKFETRGPYRTHPLEATKSMGARPNLVYPIPGPDGSEVWPERQWLWSQQRAMEALRNNELEFVKGRDGEWRVHTKQYLRDDNGKTREAKAFSIIDNVYSQHGTNEILDIFGDARIFPFPKPTGLITQLLQLVTEPHEGDVVMDFFCGSGTTAHSILALNRQDGGNRQFITVQLPEPTGRPDYPSIADIGRERMRRVIARLQAGDMDPLDIHKDEDLGFKCYRLDHSHFEAWQEYTGAESEELETLFSAVESPLVEEWDPQALLSEVMLLEGFPLDSRGRPLPEFNHNRVQEVASDFCQHRLYVCLDETIAPDTVAAVQLRAEDVFVCLDSALSDEAKITLSDRCNVKVI